MAAALILYGSRARGEVHNGSDVDLILAEDGMSLRAPRTGYGVSVHLYSKDWLEAEAQSGSLFVYHVAHEGIALQDDDGYLEILQHSFRKKLSYRTEVEIAGLVLRMLIEQNWHDNRDARRRYFWALRTIIISTTADRGEFVFSSSSLELKSRVQNLQAHIDGRDHATFEECRMFGAQVLEIAGNLPGWTGEQLRDHLLALGGIARDSVRVIEEREASETQGFAVYL